jgi:hypothetical protein
LSEVFWVALGSSRPKAPENAGALWQLGYIVLREAPGFAVLGFYFGALPPAMVLYSKFFRGLFVRMGFLRYMVMSNLLLTMILLPVKMGCRFVFNLKYFIAIPEYFTNF